MKDENMQADVSPQDIKRGGHPHELLLINLILNHVLIFIATMGLAGSYPLLPLVVPFISVSIVSFIFYRARLARTRDTLFVSAHWQICAQRSRIFLIMLAGACLLLLLGWLAYAYLGMAKVTVLALFAVAILPVMATILVLVVLESDAMNHARKGTLPEWALQRYGASARKISN